MGKLKKVEEVLIVFLFLEFGSFKIQLDDEYIVVEFGLFNIFENKLKEREVEIRKVIVYVKKLEEMYNIVEERMLIFEKQVFSVILNLILKYVVLFSIGQ